MIYDQLKENGIFIGIDWFSTKHSCFKYGIEVGDCFTKNAKEGYFADMGNVHFSDKEHILDLFSNFKMEILEEKVVNQFIPNDSILATWNFVAKK